MKPIRIQLSRKKGWRMPPNTPCNNWLDEVVAAVSVAPYYRDDAVVIFNADCREIVPHIPKACLLLTDPPYGRNGEEPFAVTETVLAFDQWDAAAVILDWRNPIRGPRKVGEIVWQYGWVSGFRAKAKAGVCHTHNTVHLLGDAKRMRFTDGSIVLRQPGFSSPRHCSFAAKSGHPYEKPVPFLRWLLQRIEGDTVLDPFAGSGTTLEAAKQEGATSVGIEIEERWCEVAAKRLQQGALLCTANRVLCDKKGAGAGVREGIRMHTTDQRCNMQ